MAEQFKQQSKSNFDSSIAYSDADLKQAFESFVQEEPKQVNQSLVNFPTVAGFLMLLVGLTYVIGTVLPGIDAPFTITQWVRMLPLIGGVLVTFIGLGWFSRNKKKKKKVAKDSFNADFLNSSSTKTADSKFQFGSNTKTSSNKSQSKSQSDFEAAYYDTYALKKSKKLFKSKSDKKISGVCGGIARYLGVSSTFLRLAFVVAAFMGYGSPILLYFILSFLLPEEPKLTID